MDLYETKAVIEGLLFAAGDSVEIDRIADIIEMDKKTTKEIISKMMDDYNIEKRGIKIIQLGSSYQMCTKPEYFDYIQRLAEPKRMQNLSNAAMEVLSIIAYRQPVTRAMIESIRGVSCDAIINRLIERNLIEETGRLDVPGRPMIFGTTEEFLRSFGVADLTELPDYDKIATEPQYKQQTMEGILNNEEEAEEAE
ncbi:MAG: SMC-Scp complex subunit ScpB [Clostridia bacterium]|nr:SMC-Scp complex subunit ScpB [Clostridia bacterium]